ncbi:MAG: hypothetical protein OHK0037_37560 [Elainellaceae cyanobacterium]
MGNCRDAEMGWGLFCGDRLCPVLILANLAPRLVGIAKPTWVLSMSFSNSIDLERYAEQAAALMGLPIPDDCKPGVIANLERTAAIAQLVLEFPLPPEVEGAAVFVPRGTGDGVTG